MRKLLFIAMAAVLISGLACAKSDEITKQAGEYTVVVKMDKTPPATGTNTVSILIKERSGRAVTDAQVDLDYEMPAMPGMPAMSYKAATVLKGETYVGTVNFSMGGAWGMIVRISRGGETASVKLNVDVR